MDIEEFIEEHRRLLNISAIEKLAGMPKRTLHHVLMERRDLRVDQEVKILEVLRGLRSDIDGLSGIGIERLGKNLEITGEELSFEPGSEMRDKKSEVAPDEYKEKISSSEQDEALIEVDDHPEARKSVQKKEKLSKAKGILENIDPGAGAILLNELSKPKPENKKAAQTGSKPVNKIEGLQITKEELWWSEKYHRVRGTRVYYSKINDDFAIDKKSYKPEGIKPVRDRFKTFKDAERELR